MLSTLVSRFVAPTPKFWRKIRNAAVGLAAGLKVVDLAGIVPGPWVAALKTIMTLATAVGTTAQFTCMDAPADEPAATTPPAPGT